MTPRILPTTSFLFIVIALCLLSCEKDEVTTAQKLVIEVIVPSGSAGSGSLTVTSPNGTTSTISGLTYNQVEEIDLEINSTGDYVFEMDDPDFGRIKMFANSELLQNYSLEDPFRLQFEHYKNERVATFQVKSSLESPSQIRFIDLTLSQTFDSSLYYIDWGDGTVAVVESPRAISESPSDRIEHRYQASGDYTITISTTNLEEVTGVELQITGNGIGDHIQTMELEDLPNLTTLGIGDSDLLNIDSILAKFPQLNQLSVRFGNLVSIDVSQNPLLELLIISDNFDTEIKGLSTLTNLQFLGLTGIVEDLNLSNFSELTHLSLKGHKATSIDVSQNTKLTSLLLQLNELEEINLDSNVNLETLSITNNLLTELDLSNNPEIKNLNLYANYIEELDLSKQEKLEYLNLSSVHLKQVAAPESLDNITFIDLSDARFLNEKELLDAVFKGQENNLKKEGRILFNEFAVIIEEQIELLQELVDTHDWDINIPD